MFKKILIISVLMLAACSHWEPTHRAQEPFVDAELDCKFQAEAASAGGATMADRVSANVSVFQACMRAKGFVLVRN